MGKTQTAKTIAISSRKGGVGKTTTAISLAVGLARAGKKVLMLDCDPQHSTTISLPLVLLQWLRSSENQVLQVMGCRVQTEYSARKSPLWVGRMNNIRSSAEEVVLGELVYC